MEEIVISVLPVIAILLPLLSTGPVFFARRIISEDFRDYLAIGAKKQVKKVDPGLSMLIPIVALALGCLLFGIFANLPLSIIELAVHALFG